MKRLLIATILILLVHFLNIPAHAIITYNVSGVTSGGSRDLDALSVDDLNNSDRAIAAIRSGNSLFYSYYLYDSSGTTAEQTNKHPYTIRPDDYATGGAWTEVSVNWVEFTGDLSIANLTVTNNLTVGGTNTVNNLDATGRLSGSLVETGITTGTVTLSGVSQRGGVVHNRAATSGATVVMAAASKGDSVIIVLARDMFSGGTIWAQFNSADTIINSTSFNCGTAAGTSYYYLSNNGTSGVTGEGINLIAIAANTWYVYEDGSPARNTLE